ncbi:MAG: four helix bundle protein [Candidatus Omnitrophica bacterium]|nr:four helix bundle protein [Candidatus Omnitrophota bacterium]
MKIERFEDLIAWQEARKLVNLIYDITQRNNFKDFGLAAQIQRASVSVMANISEGFGRYSFKDSKQFFTMARGSVSEVQSHLYVILDRKMISEELFKDTYEQAIKTSKLINGLIRNVNNQIGSSEPTN